MNPRYRRLLIPGLLVVLIVVVLLTALSRQANGSLAGEKLEGEVVCTITEEDIQESSGLVLSREHDDVAYTINDSGNDPIVYAIKVSTGALVGTTTLSNDDIDDPEALSIDNDGTLWFADIGDNDGDRDDIALYALPESGPGNHTVEARWYPLEFDKGPRDAETLLINPKTNDKYIVTKMVSGGELFPIPKSLTAGRTNHLTQQAEKLPVLTTDGAFTPDGRHAVLRTLGEIQVFDAKDWSRVRSDGVPAQEQGETLAMEPDGDSVLIGSEGENSQLLRVALKINEQHEPTDSPPASEAAAEPVPEPPEDNPWWQWAALASILLGGAGLVALVRRR